MARKQSATGSAFPTKKALIWGGVGLLVVGGGVLAYNHFAKGEDTTQPPATTPVNTGVGPMPVTNPAPSDAFPLQRGSRGAAVKALQEALIAIGGNAAKEIQGAGGADGVFGAATERAVIAAGQKVPVSLVAYNEIIGRSKLAAGNQTATRLSSGKVTELREKLVKAYRNNELSLALEALREIRNSEQYTQVNIPHMRWDFWTLINKTIVNALLEKFTNEQDKELLRIEFARMGLVERNGAWQLAGLDSVLAGQLAGMGSAKQAVVLAKMDTQVMGFDGKGQTLLMNVPRGTRIGLLISTDPINGFAHYRTLDGKIGVMPLPAAEIQY